MLANKKILLGVTGSIAAYKSASLIRLLVKAGAEVKVVMTHSAIDFITPLTLSTLSRNPVLSQYWDKATGEWNNHVELALWADLILIAPASANTISKMAYGACDNLLTAVYLSAKCKVAVAPAMDLDMYRHPVVRENIARLKQSGNLVIPAETGELASGLTGEGRMAEPEHIFQFVEDFFAGDTTFVGKKALVSAGPTFEKIDPVRFIGNHSSGKMGISIANELSSLGARVTLVFGPGTKTGIKPGIEVVDVVSAKEMFDACVSRAASNDIIVMNAAVADYTPKTVSDKKLKKGATEMSLEMEKTADILKKLGEIKKKNQVLVGFALETDNEMAHAVEKLNKKNLDLIVLNSLNDKGAGFQSDTNKITIIDQHLKAEHFPLKTKKEVARDIVHRIAELPQMK